MLRSLLVAMACLAGCTSAAVPRRPAAPQPQQPPKPQPFAGPMPVAFGACSSAQTRWVSGPRPAQRGAHEHARVAGVLGTEATQDGAFASLTGTADGSGGFDDTDIYGGLLGNETGSAGPGAGWGTIGTGTYGTIGHGSGTGTGYGVDDGHGRPRGKATAVPNMTLGQPVALGDLDRAIIRRYVKRNIMKLQYCYEKQLLAKPGIQGTILAEFYIAPSGDVTRAKGTGFDPEVARCVAGVIQSIQFPKPKHDTGVQVSYPFRFRSGQASPTSQGAPVALDKQIIRRFIKRDIQKIQYCYEKQLLVTPGIKGTIHTHFFITPSGKVANATGEGFDPTVASCVAGVIKQIQFPKPKGGGGVAVNYPFVFHEADDASSSGAGSAAGSDVPPPAAPVQPPASAPAAQPSVANPLQPASLELEACFRQDPVPYGAVVVEMHYGAAGAVSSASVYGIDDAATRACVAEVAKHVRPASPAQVQRCSLAFGQMPVSALPAIDIAGGSITFGGHALPAPPPDNTTPTYAELSAELAGGRDAARAPNGPVVSIQGPLVVRPDDATPMSAVYVVLDSVRGVHEDFVLAAQRGAGWRLLRDDVTLPAVPVPVGAPDAPAAAPDDERVDLSVYIGKDHVWVGLSRVNEFTELARGADLADALAKALKEQKMSAFFADRTDIEIGADDAVSYADVVTAIDAATRVGFTDWKLERLAELSARPTP